MKAFSEVVINLDQLEKFWRNSALWLKTLVSEVTDAVVDWGSQVGETRVRKPIFQILDSDFLGQTLRDEETSPCELSNSIGIAGAGFLVTKRRTHLLYVLSTKKHGILSFTRPHTDFVLTPVHAQNTRWTVETIGQPETKLCEEKQGKDVFEALNSLPLGLMRRVQAVVLVRADVKQVHRASTTDYTRTDPLDIAFIVYELKRGKRTIRLNSALMHEAMKRQKAKTKQSPEAEQKSA